MIIPDTHKVPHSVEEAFKMLDEMLDDKDKKDILDGADVHFGLGLWIRNEWLFGANREETETLLDDFERMDKAENPDECFSGCYLLGDGDFISDRVIQLYTKHLEKK